jgi:hypothetical protein
MYEAYISIEQAREHLREDFPDSDDNDIQSKLVQACDIVRDYLHVHDAEFLDSSLAEGNAPPRVVAATLLVLGELYRNREKESDPISPGVVRLLSRTRDPVMA